MCVKYVKQHMLDKGVSESVAVFLLCISALSSTPLRSQTDHSASSSLCKTTYISQIKAM